MASDSTLSQYGDGASHELSNFDYQNLSLYEKLLRLSFTQTAPNRLLDVLKEQQIACRLNHPSHHDKRENKGVRSTSCLLSYFAGKEKY
jgi:hypothetical protein